MADKTAPEYAIKLPVPHIWGDGSVTEMWVARLEYSNTFTLSDERGALIVIGDPTHARALARALTVAANHLDSNPEK